MTQPSPSAAVSTQLRLLGDPAVVVGSEVKALERRAAGLLALVALEPGVTRARAAALLWPESDNARQALRQQIARFKKNYGAELVRGEDALFIGDGVAVDALTDAAGELLGDLSFDDCADFGAWLAQQRRQRRGNALAAIGRRLAEAEAQGDWEAAVALADQLLATDSDSEAHHRTLIRLHYLRGDIAQAQAAYDRLARHLRVRFGARPSAETEQVAGALRAAQPRPPPASSSSPQAAVPVTVLRPPRLIGRARELQALGEAWATSRVALVTGEPGLGKTRLLAEFAAGRQVLSVQGRPGDAGVPYATLSRLLRTVFDRTRIELTAPRRTELARLLPELAPALPLPADGQRLLLQGAVEAALAQTRAEGVIVDDLHFADEASLETLQALICGAGEHAVRGLRWALAQRPAEGGAAATALREALQDADALAAITLAPLTSTEMAELIESLGVPELCPERLAPQLVRHTGGNPLFALETLKHALARGRVSPSELPMPVSVGALLERRLRQLSERALALARVAAVAGVDFSIALAEFVMGVRAVDLADAWQELEGAQVLREQAFAHDLVHDAVLRSLPAPIARHLHAAVAEFLEANAGEGARVAGHYLAAGLEQRALPALHRAAAAARTGLRRREELGFLMAAARIEEASGATEAAWRTLQAASEAHMCVSTVPDADLETARDRLARTPQQQAQLAQDRGDFLVNIGRFVQAEAQARQAVQAARRSGSAQRLAEALSTLSCALAMQGRLQEALEPSDEMLALLERIAEPKPKLYSERGVLLDNLGRPRDSMPMHRAAVELALARGERSLAVSALSNLACAQMDAGRAHAALQTFAQTIALAESHDDGAGLLASAKLSQCSALRELGRYQDALRATEVARAALSAGAAHYLPMVDIVQAAIWWHLGQIGRAQKVLPSEASVAELPGWLAARRWLVLARCRAALGQPIGDALAQAEQRVAQAGVQIARDVVALHAAAASATLDGLDRLQALAASARRDGRDGVALSAACYGARLAAALGLRHLALSQADEARAALEPDTAADEPIVPADIGEPEAWLCLVEVYAANGRADQASAARNRAAAWLERTEREQVAAEFRESFRRRNPVHWAIWSGRGVAPARRPG